MHTYILLPKQGHSQWIGLDPTTSHYIFKPQWSPFRQSIPALDPRTSFLQTAPSSCFPELFGFLDQDSKYISKLTASIEVCLGFASWTVNNTVTPTSYLQDPIDIACVPETFNLTAWRQNTSLQFPLGVLGLGGIQLTIYLCRPSRSNVILATLNHTDSKNKLDNIYASMLSTNPSIPIPPQCSHTKASQT